jgi:DNA mismatch repair protein MutL
MKIKVLPPEINSKIAAGEVIERPASVIKELVENSLDALSNTIEIMVKNAGKTLIQIRDSGSGIIAEDLKNIFQRHATSKINTIEDLYAINSLGFRGEALYSIAAISDITLRSKQAENDSWEIHLRAGQRLELKPTNMTAGTEIIVRELFFNTPARKKFLKTDSAELTQIIHTIIPYTLIYPQTRFKLSTPTRTIIDLTANSDHLNRVCTALNLNPKHILEAENTLPEHNITFKVFLGDMNIQRPRKDLQFLFVNNRPVHNRSLSFLLNQAYRTIMPQYVNPFFCLFLTVPPDNVDANVHPTKREVKIRNEQAITNSLVTICEQLLQTQGKPKQIYKLSPDTLAQTESVAPVTVINPVETHKQYALPIAKETLNIGEIFDRAANFTIEPKPLVSTLGEKLTDAEYIGQFKKKYLFFETGSSLLIIDQHAAQERITFEKLKQQIESNTLEVQNLLMPIILNLNPAEMTNWQKRQETLQTLGFSTSLWDKTNVAVHSHPLLIQKPEIAARNLLEETTIELYDKEKLARQACRNSLMTGYEMSKVQALFLRRNLLQCQNPFTCPHGRPTVTEIPEKILEREFLR